MSPEEQAFWDALFAPMCETRQVGAPTKEDRCPDHHTLLQIDALRGLVCTSCDAELDRWGHEWPRRVGRACRRLWHEALDAMTTSHDPWSD